MHDRPFFAAGPGLGGIREGEAIEGDLGDGAMLLPGKTGIARAIHHAALADDPAGLRVGKTNVQKIGELSAGPPARECVVDPVHAAIGCLKQSPGVADGPAV